MTALASSMLGQVRARRRNRRRGTTVLLLGLMLGAFALALYLGDFPVAPAAIVQSLLSPLTGAVDKGVDFIVLQLRLPRASLALLSGAAFGLSGIIFQTLLRNPLASPDIVGISHGASAAAVFCIIVLGWTGLPVSLGAFAGALLTALVMYALAWRGGVTAYRVVLVGIGLAAMLSASISFLFTRARINEVEQAMVWLVGSLNAARSGDVLLLAIAMLVLTMLLLPLLRGLDALELGDDAGRALCANVERTRLALLMVAVGFAAFATAAVGPVGFVAFVAGPLARGTARRGRAGLPPCRADRRCADAGGRSHRPARHSRRATAGGVVTGLFGALFLLGLLIVAGRAGRLT